VSRGSHKMRRVQFRFRAAPRDWATDPRHAELAHVRWTWLLLECGHVKRDPLEVYGNETAVRVRAVFHALDQSHTSRRVRCHQCAGGPPQAMLPRVLPDGLSCEMIEPGR
jgi:hypothetical protein